MALRILSTKGAFNQTMTTASVTPVKDEYFRQMNNLMDDNGYEYTILIRGVNNEEDEDLTRLQIENQLRFILIGESRKKIVEKYKHFGDPRDGYFDTSVGNDIMFSIEPEIKKIMRRKSLPDKFSHLLGMTYSLYNTASIWLCDNEGWMDGETNSAVKKLAGAWKRILKNSNTDLEIDAQYTRPGVEAMLEDFAENCEDQEYDLSFNWK